MDPGAPPGIPIFNMAAQDANMFDQGGHPQAPFVNLEASAALAESRRREQEEFLMSERAEQRQHLESEYAAAIGHAHGQAPNPLSGGCGQGNGTSSTSEQMLLQMLQMMQQQMQQQNAMMQQQTQNQTSLINSLMNRLQVLEAGSQNTTGSTAPTGNAQGMTSQFGSQAGPTASSTSGGSTQFPAEGKLPFGVEIPKANWNSWRTRHQEILGWHGWVEQFLHWLNLISEVYPKECRDCLKYSSKLDRTMLSSDQWQRSQRLLSFLKQSLAGWHRAEALLTYYTSTETMGDSHGYEALRILNLEFGLQSRAEALSIRDSIMNFSTKETRIMDTVRMVETRL